MSNLPLMRRLGKFSFTMQFWFMPEASPRPPQLPTPVGTFSEFGVQDVWATKLPYVESVVASGSNIHQVCCRVCSVVEGKNKLLVPNFYSKHKHGGRRKAIKFFFGIEVGSFFLKVTMSMLKREIVCCSRLRHVLQMVTTLLGEKAKASSVCKFF